MRNRTQFLACLSSDFLSTRLHLCFAIICICCFNIFLPGMFLPEEGEYSFILQNFELA